MCFCQCGCGQRTPVAKKTRALLGHVKGQNIPYINGHNRRKSERYVIEDRGYETPCHIWQLAISQWGYGLEAQGYAQKAAHVAAWERQYGKVPDGYQLDHLCRQRSCINPDHLEPVIPAVNIQRGDKARLTPEDVRSIRRLLDKGLTQKAIAPMFGVCRGTIGAIARGKTWINIV